jgi:hypothetical protein
MYDGADFLLNMVSVVATDDGAVSSVTVNYSTSQGSYDNEIALSNTDVNTWEAALGINEPGTFYYKITATDNSFQSVSSEEQTFVISEGIHEVLADEPTNHAGNLTLENQNRNNFTIGWDNNIGETAHNGFVLIISTGTLTIPVDGEMFTEDYNLNDGYGLIAIADSLTSVHITIPGYETEWSCMLIPYSGTETVINYKTDETIPQITLYTPLNDMPNAWINELHYDNDGTDIDEKVEVVIENSSDFNLTDFKLLLYNGSNGELQSSGIKTFPELPEETNGTYDIFVIPVSSIQNGPEAIALVYQSNIIQFLSYEGTVYATEGDANNITSVDIGVEETTSTTPGYSLQLTGTGDGYDDFVWQEPQQLTFGAVNTNQSLTASVRDETTWNGSVSENWNIPENWSNGVPQSDTKVVIPAECGFYPTPTEQVHCKTLVLESDASLAGQEYLPESTILYIKRNLQAGRWQYLTPPTAGTTSHIFEPALGAIYLISYNNNEPTDGTTWSYLQEPSLMLNPMEGYGILSTREDLELEFIGSPLQQNVSKPLFYNLDGNNWNFIGNPFLGSIKWDYATVENTTNSAYLFDPENKTYITIDSDGKINGGTEDGYIAPMQGFFVESISSATSVLDISSTVNSAHHFLKSNTLEEEFVQIKVKGTNGCDNATVKFSDNNSDIFDKLEDSRKLLYSDIGVPQVFFTSDNEKISVMQLKNYTENLPLSISITDDTEITMETTISETFNDSITVILNNSVTGEAINIRENREITLNLEEGDNSNRFFLSFIKKNGSTTETITSNPTLNEENTNIYSVENGIKIVSDEFTKSTIDVYSVTGQKIVNRQLQGYSTCTIQTGKGVFIIKLTNGKKVFAQKVVVSN